MLTKYCNEGISSLQYTERISNGEILTSTVVSVCFQQEFSQNGINNGCAFHILKFCLGQIYPACDNEMSDSSTLSSAA